MMDELIERGQQVYDEELKHRLEPEYKGNFVAIEPKTKRYFLGATGTEALVTACNEMPQNQFYLKRVGSNFTDKLGGRGLRRRASGQTAKVLTKRSEVPSRENGQ